MASGLVEQIVVDIPSEHLSNIFGGLDSHIKKIEKNLDVRVISRDGVVKVEGESGKLELAKRVFDEMLTLSLSGETITDQNVNYILSISKERSDVSLAQIEKDIIAYTVQGKPVKPKTLGQKKYVDNIRDKMMVFGVGPAGTGKTYLAMAMAIQAFKQNEVEKIILTRPAIEAGENLGFLPGDLQSKIDPYLRPLYDALYQIMGAESFIKNSEKGLIEVAPLAYMRGRTLDNAYIILDEAQNTTPSQMKMFLTRIGFGSKVVITGDLSQKDLKYNELSGLEQALTVLKSVEEIGVSYLSNKDVVRHPLVQKIVHAYEKFEAKEQYKEKYKKQHKKNEGR
ncbi:PhoH family protein [Eubacterium xylanophilum]|uniref:PhoH family protein n=1 Tax=Eubacterium xylanophilum TaxID=39497 RepID=UPI00047EDF03|nr:PhoH family protein [Eubacterium xylanophilum]MCR5796942.1 PhoH family protein [Eubacterium sp.]